jgi:tape measure domain-containing protein
MLTTANKLPSTYISNLLKISEAQDKLARSSSNLTNETRKQSKEITSLLAKKNALLSSNKSLSKAVDDLENKLRKANAQLTALRNATTAAATAQGNLNNRTRESERNVDRLNMRLGQANTAMMRFGAGMGSVTNLMGAFGISTGLYLFAGIVKNIYTTTRQLESLDLALKMVSGTTDEYIKNQSFLVNLAEQYGIEIKGLTKNFTEFWVASKGKLEAEQIKGIFTSISKSVAVMGLSVEQQDSAFLALQQMMSKGTVQAEELKKQLGNALPGAIKAATMAYQKLHPELQVTEKMFFEQMKMGKILSSELLPELAKAYEVLYGIENIKRAETLQAVQARLSNTWVDLVRSMNESETGGISKFFSLVVNGANFALEAIVRLNTSKENLFRQSRDKGNSRGEAAYKSQLENLAGDKMTPKERQKVQDEIRSIKGQMANGYDIDQEGNSNKDKLDKLYEKIGTGSVEDVNMSIRKNAYKNIKIQQQKLNRLKQETNDYSTLLGGKGGRGMSFIEKDIEEANEMLGYYEALAKSAINYKEEVKKIPPVATETDKDKKAREKSARDFAKDLEERNKEIYAAGLSQLEMEKFLLNEKLLLKDNSYSENLRIATEIAIKEQEIAKYVYDEEIRLAKGSKDKKIVIDNKYYKEKVALAKEALDRIDKLEYKPQYKDKGKVADEEKYGSGVFETNPDTYKDMVDLWDKQQTKKDEIAAKEKERMLAMRDVLNDIFKEFGQATGFEKTMDMFSKVGKNGKTFWENLTGGKDGEIELKDGLIAGLTLTQDIGNKIADDQQKKFEDRREQLEIQKEEALKNAGEGAAAKAAIEEEYSRKSKELSRKEAVSKKKQALFNIALDTAQAIMGLWVKPGFPAAIPMAIAVGALGAVQLAMASSRPIPSFYVGTDNAPQGLANTDEFGAEMHLDKYGNIKDLGSNSGPRIKYLESGDKIIPAAKTAEILRANEFSSLDSILSLNNILYNDNKNNQLDTSGIISSINSLSQTISNKETSEEHYDVRGWTKYTRANGQITEDKNNRIRFKKSIL